MSGERWEELTEWPLTVAAVVFLAAYSVPIIASTPPHPWRLVCEVFIWVTWAVFVVDFAVRLRMSRDPRRYALKHWLDIVIIALPVLRPLRLLRLVTVLKMLNRRATQGLRGRVAVYVAGGSALLAYCGALAVLDAERHAPDANITSFGKALWWAASTMTTVGYGDTYPVTGEGQLVAVALMIGGIALLGVVTASLAAWLIDTVNEAELAQTRDLLDEIDALHAKLDRLLPDDDARTERPASAADVGGTLG